jgi:transcriptional regulator with XRE-family HTH domain
MAQIQYDNIRIQQAERLEKIRYYIKLNQSDFAAYLEIQPGSYSDIKRGKNGISRNILTRLENKLNININWLLYGDGLMLRDVSKLPTSTDKEIVIPYKKMNDDGAPAFIDKLFKIIEKKDEQIQMHLETIRKQSEQIDKLINK